MMFSTISPLVIIALCCLGSSVSAITCPAGNSCDVNGVPTPCPAGKFSVANAGFCTDCRPTCGGSCTQIGRTTDCEDYSNKCTPGSRGCCDAGYIVQPDMTCAQCPAG